ncbi:MAG: hypothetical protein ACPHID_03310 [Thermoplasmatota archaeon]
MRWALLLLLLPLLSGCSSPPEIPEPEYVGGEAVIRMAGDVGDQFSPSEFQVPQGTVIRFAHGGGDSVHNVRSLDGAWEHRRPDLQDFVLDTSGLAPGSYRFQCDAHVTVGMTGVLHVT